MAWYILPDGKVDKMAKYFTETGISVREHFDFFGECRQHVRVIWHLLTV